jgi:hypothetical protein
MSGGLQPWAKYEQVVAEPCCPMKLEVVPGVELPVPVAELPPFTPLVPLTLPGPFPFGHLVSVAVSSMDEADPPLVPLKAA